MTACANVRCGRSVSLREMRGRSRARFNLCPACSQLVTSRALPIGGYIASPALRAIGRSVLRRADLTPSDKAAGVYYARGREYPRGSWDGRPVYRMAVLKYRKRRQRMHHLLLGKRKVLTPEVIVLAVVHYTVLRTVMDLGHRYAVFAAGATFFGRQGMCAPPGRKQDVALGDSRYSKWKLNYSDFSMLGAHALKAAQAMGIDHRDRDLQAFITTTYVRGVETGSFRPPVSVPHHAMHTTYLGDTIFDHRLTRRTVERSGVPRMYLDQIRRSSGLVNRTWPDGIDPPSNLLPRETLTAKPAAPPVATDWIFNQ